MITLESKDILGCCASKNFSALLAARSPFPNVESVLNAAHDIWWNEVIRMNSQLTTLQIVVGPVPERCC